MHGGKEVPMMAEIQIEMTQLQDEECQGQLESNRNLKVARKNSFLESLEGT